MAYYAGMAVIPAKWLEAVRGLDRPGRELALGGVALLAGALLMPLLVWIAGGIALGPYANGGYFALLADFFRGLVDGSLACWILLAGPYVVLSLLRLLRATLATIAARG